jgi:hypothetical protein
MNALAALAGPLRALPAPIRRTLYTILTGLGAVLAALVAAGVKDLGPVTVDRLLEIFAYLSSALGVVAVANVTPAEDGAAAVGLFDVDDDLDMSSFAPVEDENDVFAQAVD